MQYVYNMAKRTPFTVVVSEKMLMHFALKLLLVVTSQN